MTDEELLAAGAAMAKDAPDPTEDELRDIDLAINGPVIPDAKSA
jgi:hypothetical protein